LREGELESRLRKRSISDNVRSEEIIQRRLDTARREIENYPNYDYIRNVQQARRRAPNWRCSSRRSGGDWSQ